MIITREQAIYRMIKGLPCTTIMAPDTVPTRWTHFEPEYLHVTFCIPPERKVARTVWANEYSGKLGGYIALTEDSARATADPGATRQVQFREVIEGELTVDEALRKVEKLCEQNMYAEVVRLKVIAMREQLSGGQS